MSFALITNLLGTACVFTVMTFAFLHFMPNNRTFASDDWLKQGIAALVFGGLAVYGTHTAVQYETALINIRDVAPLAAGLLFGPLAGVGAGLIGGIERYFQGGFTAVPCCVATILAGLLAGLFSLLGRRSHLYKNGILKPAWGLTTGLVMEILHMGLILLLRQDEAAKAWAIVAVIGLPMILFAALGLALVLLVATILKGDRQQWVVL